MVFTLKSVRFQLASWPVAGADSNSEEFGGRIGSVKCCRVGYPRHDRFGADEKGIFDFA